MSGQAVEARPALPPALARRAEADALGHAWILCGAPEARLEAMARTLGMALLCEGADRRPCGACRPCRKVERDIHPDFQWVEKPAERRQLPVERIRALRADVYIRPNEGRRKVYAIRNAWQMNDEAQNAFLKVLEEGPEYGAFLLLSENPLALLPTVRSRCELLRLEPQAGADPQLAERGAELARALLGEDPWEMARQCVPWEKGKREEVLALWEAARQAALAGRDARAVRVAQALGEAVAAGERNGNMGALWGRLWAAAQGDDL